MKISPDLRRYILEAIAAQQNLAIRQDLAAKASADLKTAQDTSNRTSQRLLDELRKDRLLKTGRRVVTLEGKHYLVDPMASAQGGAIMEIAVDEEE